MEQKKQVYLPAIIKIVPLAGDLLTTSGGHDETDNWYNDIFSS